jgi:hypothetical protein
MGCIQCNTDVQDGSWICSGRCGTSPTEQALKREVEQLKEELRKAKENRK